MKMIYIAGPYRSADQQQAKANILAAEAAGCRIIADGRAFPVVPHSLGDGQAHQRETLYEAGTLALMTRCSAVLALPTWESSKGATLEIQVADRARMPVFYSHEELFAWIDGKATGTLHGQSGTLDELLAGMPQTLSLRCGTRTQEIREWRKEADDGLIYEAHTMSQIRLSAPGVDFAEVRSVLDCRICDGEKSVYELGGKFVCVECGEIREPATGGIVPSGKLYIFGRGEPEMVIPLAQAGTVSGAFALKEIQETLKLHGVFNEHFGMPAAGTQEAAVYTPLSHEDALKTLKEVNAAWSAAAARADANAIERDMARAQRADWMRRALAAELTLRERTEADPIVRSLKEKQALVEAQAVSIGKLIEERDVARKTQRWAEDLYRETEAERDEARRKLEEADIQRQVLKISRDLAEKRASVLVTDVERQRALLGAAEREHEAAKQKHIAAENARMKAAANTDAMVRDAHNQISQMQDALAAEKKLSAYHAGQATQKSQALVKVEQERDEAQLNLATSETEVDVLNFEVSKLGGLRAHLAKAEQAKDYEFKRADKAEERLSALEDVVDQALEIMKNEIPAEFLKHPLIQEVNRFRNYLSYATKEKQEIFESRNQLSLHLDRTQAEVQTVTDVAKSHLERMRAANKRADEAQRELASLRADLRETFDGRLPRSGELNFWVSKLRDEAENLRTLLADCQRDRAAEISRLNTELAASRDLLKQAQLLLSNYQRERRECGNRMIHPRDEHGNL